MDELKQEGTAGPQPEAATPEAEALAQDRPVPEVAPLETELATAVAERDQFRELAARAQAEGINYRHWAEREFKRLKAVGAERAVTSLLPVLDNLERAMAAGGDEEALRQGVRMVRDQFLNALSGLGVTVIDPTGQVFSPLEHHAVGLVPTTDRDADGRVVEVFQKGYDMNGTAIRPAQVRVGKYESPAPASETPEA